MMMMKTSLTVYLTQPSQLSRFVWENVDLSRVYRPHWVRSGLTTSAGQDSPIQTSGSVNKS